MARTDPSWAVEDTNRIPLRPEGGLKRKIFRLLGIGSSRKLSISTSTKDISSSPSPTSPEKRRRSRLLGLVGDHNPKRGAERLQHVRESKIRQPLDTGDAGSISFSTASLQNSDRTGGGAGIGVGGGAGSPLVGTGEPAPPPDSERDAHSPLTTDSTVGDHELNPYDSATTSNTSTHYPLETAMSNKPPSTLSDNTAATSFTHPNRPLSATPVLIPPHSPIAPSTSSLHPRLTDDASVLTLASSSKRVRRRNSFDTNASMLAIAPGSRRDSEESVQETDSNEPSILGARRSVGSVLSSKLEGVGKARSVATGHSVGVGEEGEDERDDHIEAAEVVA